MAKGGVAFVLCLLFASASGVNVQKLFPKMVKELLSQAKGLEDFPGHHALMDALSAEELPEGDEAGDVDSRIDIDIINLGPVYKFNVMSDCQYKPVGEPQGRNDLIIRELDIRPDGSIRVLMSGPEKTIYVNIKMMTNGKVMRTFVVDLKFSPSSPVVVEYWPGDETNAAGTIGVYGLNLDLLRLVMDDWIDFHKTDVLGAVDPAFLLSEKKQRAGPGPDVDDEGTVLEDELPDQPEDEEEVEATGVEEDIVSEPVPLPRKKRARQSDGVLSSLWTMLGSEDVTLTVEEDTARREECLGSWTPKDRKVVPNLPITIHNLKDGALFYRAGTSVKLLFHSLALYYLDGFSYHQEHRLLMQSVADRLPAINVDGKLVGDDGKPITIDYEELRNFLFEKAEVQGVAIGLFEDSTGHNPFGFLELRPDFIRIKTRLKGVYRLQSDISFGLPFEELTFYVQNLWQKNQKLDCPRIAEKVELTTGYRLEINRLAGMENAEAHVSTFATTLGKASQPLLYLAAGFAGLASESVDDIVCTKALFWLPNLIALLGEYPTDPAPPRRDDGTLTHVFFQTELRDPSVQFLSFPTSAFRAVPNRNEQPPLSSLDAYDQKTYMGYKDFLKNFALNHLQPGGVEIGLFTQGKHLELNVRLYCARALLGEDNRAQYVIPIASCLHHFVDGKKTIIPSEGPRPLDSKGNPTFGELILTGRFRKHKSNQWLPFDDMQIQIDPLLSDDLPPRDRLMGDDFLTYLDYGFTHRTIHRTIQVLHAPVTQRPTEYATLKFRLNDFDVRYVKGQNLKIKVGGESVVGLLLRENFYDSYKAVRLRFAHPFKVAVSTKTQVSKLVPGQLDIELVNPANLKDVLGLVLGSRPWLVHREVNHEYIPTSAPGMIKGLISNLRAGRTIAGSWIGRSKFDQARNPLACAKRAKKAALEVVIRGRNSLTKVGLVTAHILIRVMSFTLGPLFRLLSSKIFSSAVGFKDTETLLCSYLDSMIDAI